MAFPDLPFPSHLPSFMHHTAVLQYLNDYTDKFDLRKYIQVRWYRLDKQRFSVSLYCIMLKKSTAKGCVILISIIFFRCIIRIIITTYHQKLSFLLSIYGGVRSQQIKEDVTNMITSFISWDLAQPWIENGFQLHLWVYHMLHTHQNIIDDTGLIFMRLVSNVGRIRETRGDGGWCWMGSYGTTFGWCRRQNETYKGRCNYGV